MNQNKWTPQHLKSLGKKLDSQIAASMGISISAVGQKRRSLEIPHPRPREYRKWTAKHLAMFRRKSDRQIAQLTGRRVRAVQQTRQRLKILIRHPIDWTNLAKIAREIK